MFGLPLGFLVEGSVTVLLVVTLAYCFMLNERLKRLHNDRDLLKVMVADLIQATTLANSAIKDLKTTAIEADAILGSRLEEAERFGIELANHVNAGASLMERIAKITAIARHSQSIEQPVVIEETNRVQSALQALQSRPRMRGQAA
ncbi:MAG: chemotaxis protein [Devosia sp.]|nr:chemotaxis protein [Devosia sp.]